MSVSELPLTPSEETLLDLAAKCIVAGNSSPIDLSLKSLVNCWYQKSRAIVAYLAKQVDEHSGGTRTVREAKSDLFQNITHGSYLYLAVCSPDNPDKVISEITHDVWLLGVGPYQNGVDAKPTPTGTKERNERRALRAAEARTEREREAAREIEGELLGELDRLLRGHMRLAPYDSQGHLLDTHLKYPVSCLESVIAACKCLHISAYELLEAAMANLTATAAEAAEED